MALSPIQLAVPEKLVREFKAKAKELFPREKYALVLGELGDQAQLKVAEFYYPRLKSNARNVFLEPEVLAEANEYAKEHDMQVLGDIHSHCYDSEFVSHGGTDRARSEADHYYAPLFIVQGICVVTKYPKVVRASVKWWGPAIPVETV